MHLASDLHVRQEMGQNGSQARVDSLWPVNTECLPDAPSPPHSGDRLTAFHEPNKLLASVPSSSFLQMSISKCTANTLQGASYQAARVLATHTFLFH